MEKTAQLQALQQQLSGHRTPDPELTALQHEMQESQARHSVFWPLVGPSDNIQTYMHTNGMTLVVAESGVQDAERSVLALIILRRVY